MRKEEEDQSVDELKESLEREPREVILQAMEAKRHEDIGLSLPDESESLKFRARKLEKQQ